MTSDDRYAARDVLDEQIAAQTAELFRALSDTSRVCVVSVLVEGEINLGRLPFMVPKSCTCVAAGRCGMWAWDSSALGTLDTKEHD